MSHKFLDCHNLPHF